VSQTDSLPPKAVLVAILAAQAALADPATPDYLAAAISSASRPENDRQQDSDFKPSEVIAFAGLEPGDKVAHFLPASGYLVSLFCGVVGDAGHVYAISAPIEHAADRGHVASEAPAEPADVPVGEACPSLTATVLRSRSLPAPELHSDSDDPGWVYEYWSVRRPAESFVAPEPLDLIWIADRYHALLGRAFGPASPIRVGTALLAALKPGGVLVIEDYAAKAGSGSRDAVALHRIDGEQVKKEMAAAGFELVGESSALRNPEDRRRTNAHLIDRADRFLLKFRKP
jgi:predicted methyltransferase